MSKAILSPSVTKVEELAANSSAITIEPLANGYGQTLGNSLRRVLLSSIEGAAITAFKIEGISHEFTTIPGVKEDVVEIMMNLKSVVFKSHSNEPVELTVSKTGGILTAADFAGNADVEVVNPDQLIATIDDPKASVNMTVVVETGRGYQTIEKSSANRLHSDMIALDAVYSPVRRVRYNVGDARVGDNVDLDKLVVTIDTDGSINPVDAFEEAAAILVGQYKALAGKAAETMNNVDTVMGDSASSLLDMPIEELGLTARTTNALVSNEIKTVNDLVSLTDEELDDLKGFGSKAKEEVKARVAELEF
ncbi:MAG: DNA-directed RNA polymerase subunit alpha [Candidatus Saccharibacteria bacterium]|nr:DNA-directed RNA polymerase subunit alpha [Candidatus Saccharibacteria bacterium]